jgi:hypothetical protein
MIGFFFCKGEEKYTQIYCNNDHAVAAAATATEKRARAKVNSISLLIYYVINSRLVSPAPSFIQIFEH